MFRNSTFYWLIDSSAISITVHHDGTRKASGEDAAASEPEVTAKKGGRGAAGRGGARVGSKVKASPKKAKAVAGAGAAAGKSLTGRAVVRCGGGTKWCRGCARKVDLTLFAVNQDLDVECKKIYDRLWQTARRQGQLDWLKSVRNDDDRLKHLIARFKETTKGNAKKNPFKLAEYKEKFCSKTAIMQDSQGEMMEEEEYTVHMTSRLAKATPQLHVHGKTVVHRWAAPGGS
jgi:hypothetical protein